MTTSPTTTTTTHALRILPLYYVPYNVLLEKERERESGLSLSWYGGFTKLPTQPNPAIGPLKPITTSTTTPSWLSSPKKLTHAEKLKEKKKGKKEVLCDALVLLEKVPF